MSFDELSKMKHFIDRRLLIPDTHWWFKGIKDKQIKLVHEYGRMDTPNCDVTIVY